MSPEDFFAAEHRAFHLLVIPEILQHTDHELQMKPQEILDLCLAKMLSAANEGCS
jgi:hypothetical protein